MAFTHLHVHSNFSLLDGTSSIAELVNQAKRLRFKRLALTDHNNLYCAVEFYKLAKAANIQPIIGSEVMLMDNTNLVLLVKDIFGYRNLCQILSTGHLRGGHLEFKLDVRDILKYKEGLFVLSGGQKGHIWQLAASGKTEAASQYCRQMKTWFGKHFCIELQQFQQSDWLSNMRLRDIAYQHQVALVATNDVHLLSKKDLPLRRLLHAIDKNTLFDKIDTAGSEEQYLKSAAEMKKCFRQIPRAVENTEVIAQQCRLELRLGKPVFPRLALPDGETSFSYLWKKAFQGTQKRYKILTQEIVDRLNKELQTINTLGFSDYFLIVKNIVDFCNRESIPCVGRGSAGGSLVSYVLGITQVDPLRYDLYFERFLNEGRSDPPDIDLDICWKNRDRVLSYVYQKYGKTHTAMICTFSTFQLRSAIRDAARAFGFPEDEISALTKYLPHYGISRLAEALKEIPECRNIAANLPLLEQVLEFSRRLADFPRHLSIHSGGVIIAPDDIRDYTPLQIAAKGIVISQHDMYSIESLGLVKMDLLGVRSLSIITDCLKHVKTLHEQLAQKEVSRWEPFYRYDLEKQAIVKEKAGAYITAKNFPFLVNDTEYLSPLDLRTIPENHPEIITLLRSGQTMGCPQIESPAMRGLLKKLQIDSLNDIITAVALVRPGAAESGAKDLYIQRRAGLAEADYIHPKLKAVLEETYGNIVYQEQVMQVAREIAGFSLAQADVLRRAMTKARQPQTIAGLHKDFIAGAMKNDIPRERAVEIWRFLTNFIGYGFNKAHAATYGTIAYQTTFLKYHFPLPYMCAVLNNPGGFYSQAAYVEECRRMGIKILPPDINQSEREFICRGDQLITGLGSIAELTAKTCERIIAERREGAFRDYFDFMQRVRPRRKEVEHLIKCGALRSLNPNEPGLLMKNQVYFKNKHNRNLTQAIVYQVQLDAYSDHQRIEKEMTLLGFSATDHPLALIEEKIDWEEIVAADELEEYKGERVKFVGWPVTQRRVITRQQEYLKFITFEDRYGLCESVLFPNVYKQYGHLTSHKAAFLVTGIVQSRIPGEANLIIEKLEIIDS